MSVNVEEEPRARRRIPSIRPPAHPVETEIERRIEQLTTRAVDGFEEWVNSLWQRASSAS